MRRLQRKLSSSRVQNEATHLIYKNWVINTPMETGVASPAHAAAALHAAKKYQNAYGLFVTGIDKTDEPDSVVLASRRKVFSYTGAVMTLPTGVVAVGAAKYGHVDLALETMKKLERSFSYALPGSMYEVSPDFGMMTQAWNIYGVAVPLVTEIFGIQPDAAHKRIRFIPKLPTSWDHASIKNVLVGENTISLSIRRDGQFLLCEIEQSDPTWTVAVIADAVSDANQANNNDSKYTVIDGYKGFSGEKLSVRIAPEKNILLH